MTAYTHEGRGCSSANEVLRTSITVPELILRKKQGEKITMLTCYDASFAALLDACNIDVLLVGDSLGMVCQGHNSTLPVSLTDITYHTACVARSTKNALILTDLPFGTYSCPEQAYMSAVKIMQAGAKMIKLEGGEWLSSTVRFLTERAIPVCVHLGLTPQSVHQLGGFKLQGRSPESAIRMKREARLLEDAGAMMLVLELIPSKLAAEITDSINIPTIGIGAGSACSGQVLVLHDMLNIFPGCKPRFVKDFMQGKASIGDAICSYVKAVKDGSFPEEQHSFT